VPKTLGTLQVSQDEPAQRILNILKNAIIYGLQEATKNLNAQTDSKDDEAFPLFVQHCLQATLKYIKPDLLSLPQNVIKQIPSYYNIRAQQTQCYYNPLYDAFKKLKNSSQKEISNAARAIIIDIDSGTMIASALLLCKNKQEDYQRCLKKLKSNKLISKERYNELIEAPQQERTIQKLEQIFGVAKNDITEQHEKILTVMSGVETIISTLEQRIDKNLRHLKYSTIIIALCSAVIVLTYFVSGPIGLMASAALIFSFCAVSSIVNIVRFFSDKIDISKHKLDQKMFYIEIIDDYAKNNLQMIEQIMAQDTLGLLKKEEHEMELTSTMDDKTMEEDQKEEDDDKAHDKKKLSMPPNTENDEKSDLQDRKSEKPSTNISSNTSELQTQQARGKNS
jgi:hypothetical protein